MDEQKFITGKVQLIEREPSETTITVHVQLIESKSQPPQVALVRVIETPPMVVKIHVEEVKREDGTTILHFQRALE